MNPLTNCTRLSAALVFASVLLVAGPYSTTQSPKDTKPIWLWVKDADSQVAIPGALIEIGPGEACVGKTDPAKLQVSARYVTGPSGRVLVDKLPKDFSCLIKVDGTQLNVRSGSISLGCPTTPNCEQLRRAGTVILFVERGINKQSEDVDWDTTDIPSRFLSYIQDKNSGDLIPGVTITAKRSGKTVSSNANGFFELEIPSSYRKGKLPPMATETLVFTKPGYQTIEYRQLVLNPRVIPLDILMDQGNGTIVRTNRSISDAGNFFEDEYMRYAGAVSPSPKGSGEILSFELRPCRFKDGWTTCVPGAKAIVKARNLVSLKLLGYSTGTGVGEQGPGIFGVLKKIKSSPQEDTWELELPDLMTTNLWAQGTDKRGRSVKSIDVGGAAIDR